MQIISYNVNGIRAAINKGLVDWLKTANPDVVCFQETKAQPEQIDDQLFESLGYKCYWFSAQKKGYSGVGIISKIEPLHVEYGMQIPKYDDEGRFIRADFGKFSVVSVYHPSGTTGDVRQEFKYQWLDDFREYVAKLRKQIPNLVLSGDYNICHKPIDIHDPIGNAKSSGFLPEERQWFTDFLSDGFVDTFRHFNPNPHQYTWWSYRANARSRNLGWRIDYHIVNEEMEAMLKRAVILSSVVHSDHCPILLEINS
ncbi:MAG: exodeoxyribonuclease III [Lentimicrobiaceae bacterium]|nr:exodeoxyribonuclease III [Lentimicrobiaceae bacterium]